MRSSSEYFLPKSSWYLFFNSSSNSFVYYLDVFYAFEISSNSIIYSLFIISSLSNYIGY